MPDTNARANIPPRGAKVQCDFLPDSGDLATKFRPADPLVSDVSDGVVPGRQDAPSTQLEHRGNRKRETDPPAECGPMRGSDPRSARAGRPTMASTIFTAAAWRMDAEPSMVLIRASINSLRASHRTRLRPGSAHRVAAGWKMGQARVVCPGLSSLGTLAESPDGNLAIPATGCLDMNVARCGLAITKFPQEFAMSLISGHLHRVWQDVLVAPARGNGTGS
jgi:hypothetical protein